MYLIFGAFDVRIHQVRSYNSNVAVNIWWSHSTSRLDLQTSCTRPVPHHQLTLADVKIGGFKMDIKDVQSVFSECSCVSNSVFVIGGANRKYCFQHVCLSVRPSETRFVRISHVIIGAQKRLMSNDDGPS